MGIYTAMMQTTVSVQTAVDHQQQKPYSSMLETILSRRITLAQARKRQQQWPEQQLQREGVLHSIQLDPMHQQPRQPHS